MYFFGLLKIWKMCIFQVLGNLEIMYFFRLLKIWKLCIFQVVENLEIVYFFRLFKIWKVCIFSGCWKFGNCVFFRLLKIWKLCIFQVVENLEIVYSAIMKLQEVCLREYCIVEELRVELPTIAGSLCSADCHCLGTCINGKASIKDAGNIVNTLRLRQNSQHFADFFKHICDDIWILIDISLIFVPKVK